jgi:hypothetical protein
VGGGLVGRGVENARVGDRAVTVRGLSERIVKADLAVLPLRFTTSGDILTDVQAKLDGDTRLVRAFLAQQGYKPEEIDLGRLEVTDVQSREYQSQTATARFILAQTVVVRTPDVDRVRTTTAALGDLVRQGVVLQDFRGPSYIFTKLNEVRPTMIAEATKSARSGAEQFANDSGTSLGGIRQATQGSFEILPRDQSGDDESASLNKRIRVVTTVSYQLR